jgi:hypothetical protein
VVTAGAARGDQFLADPDWKGKVCEPIAVQVTQLALTHPELDATESMRNDGDARPEFYLLANTLGCVFHFVS